MNKQTAKLLEHHFDTAFAAPDGIKKLRELILALAMQGKLVEQDPNDPPASQLLKEIEAEKKRLVKAGKIKVSKLLPESTTYEVTQEIPKSWLWVRFGDIAQHNSGKTLDKSRNTGQPRGYITTSNLYWGRFELENIRQMLMRDDEIEKCTARKNDLLICEGGEAGRAAVWDFDSEVCFQNHVHRARFYCDIDPYYAYRFFEKLNATGEISQHRKGVGISNMSSKALASIAFPLPPLKEQRRITARIDQLMARCDELEKLRAEREQKRLAVHAAALKQLLDAQEQDGLTNSWQFLAHHFGELYSVKENVAELRKAILQLAVMGKLVPQNPNDPPASQLLKEIEAEKKRLVKAGKIKEPKPLPEITSEEVPYQLPVGWGWVRLGSVFNTSSGTTFSVELEKDHGAFPYVKVGDMNLPGNELVITTSSRYIDPDAKMRKGIIPTGSIIFPKRGGAIATNKKRIVEGPIFVDLNTMAITPSKVVTTEYAYLWLLTIDLAGLNTGTSVPQINHKDIDPLLFPLPSLSEQHRIVVKIDQLMDLYNALDRQIEAATGKRSELLNAVMSQA
jgi:type I restriction enzyme S subunit